MVGAHFAGEAVRLTVGREAQADPAALDPKVDGCFRPGCVEWSSESEAVGEEVGRRLGSSVRDQCEAEQRASEGTGETGNGRVPHRVPPAGISHDSPTASDESTVEKGTLTVQVRPNVQK